MRPTGTVKLRGRVFTPRPVTWRMRGATSSSCSSASRASPGEAMSFRFSSCASAQSVRGDPFSSLACSVLAAGCSQVRGRKQIQEANELYKTRTLRRGGGGSTTQAEALVPDLPTLWLNKGYTCRQLIAPGGRDPASQRAAACALAAFRRLARAGARRSARRAAHHPDLVRHRRLRRPWRPLPRAQPPRARRRRRRARPAGGLLQVGEVARGARLVEAGGRAAPDGRRGPVRRRHLRLADPVGPRRRPRDGGLQSLAASRRPRTDSAPR